MVIDVDNRLQGSIIIPVLNEAAQIAARLQDLRVQMGSGWQIIVVDGGSTDDTVQQARAGCDQLVQSARGRSTQMNAGAAVAAGELLVFLHADTRLPVDVAEQMQVFLQSGRQWGRFDVQLDGDHPLFRVIAFMMNVRSRLTGIATGDQVFFMRREFFQQLGGFAPIPLMEDVEFSRRACRISRPWCSRAQVTTSARKWQQNGILRTVVLMWWIRLAYFVGVPPSVLHRWYYSSP